MTIPGLDRQGDSLLGPDRLPFHGNRHRGAARCLQQLGRPRRLSSCSSTDQFKYWASCSDLSAAQPIIPQSAKLICKASATAPSPCFRSQAFLDSGTPPHRRISADDWGRFKILQRVITAKEPGQGISQPVGMPDRIRSVVVTLHQECSSRSCLLFGEPCALSAIGPVPFIALGNLK